MSMEPHDDSRLAPTVYRRLIYGFVATMIGVIVIGSTMLIGRVLAGQTAFDSGKSLAVITFRHLGRGDALLDSWGPMFSAQWRLTNRPEHSVYMDSLVLDSCKFQYPPSSLLLLEALPQRESTQYLCDLDSLPQARVLKGEWAPKPWIDRGAVLAILASLLTLVATIDLVLKKAFGTSSLSGVPLSWRISLALVVSVLGLTYFPLVWGWEIGQIQVYINLFLIAGIFSFLSGKRWLAGVLVGVCIGFKPQYAVLLLWALLKREWSFLKGLVPVVVVLTVAAVFFYGFQAQLDYIAFLRGLSRHGEVFWANQSVNGLLNRFLELGDPMGWAVLEPKDGGWPTTHGSVPDQPWDDMEFPPFDTIVYAATLLSSVAMMLVALFGPRRPNSTLASTLDFCVVYMASTMASPIAWLHHYGAFLAVYGIVAVLVAKALRPSRVLVGYLCVSFLLMTCMFINPAFLYRDRWTGLIGSAPFFGALMLFVLTLRFRASPRA